MSVVTNVILSTPLIFEEILEEKTKEINSFFEKGKGFVYCDDPKLPQHWYGGTKYLEADLFIGAFNDLDLRGLIEHLKKINWEDDQECIQLIVKEQDDEVFRIINVFGDSEHV